VADPDDLAAAIVATAAEAITARAGDRPTFTISAAAEATGKSRRTIGRMLDAGELVGATRDDSGAWAIPVEALLGAGLQLHAPTPPDAANDRAATTPADLPKDANDRATSEGAQLRAELADWRRRAEVAEAIAAERAEALADVRAALALAHRMLPATATTGDFSDAPAPAPASTPEAPNTRTPETPAAGPPRRWWQRR
jgi:hypothetical protein